MTPQTFIAKWGPGGPAFGLNERQGAQPHFMDLCALLDVPTPGSTGDYLFEQNTLMFGSARGYADVFMRDHFAWENKAPGRNLDDALRQLLTYSLALSNPPLLVVCDRLTLRIHTQFNGHPSEVHTLTLSDFTEPAKLNLLRKVWTDPESFRPKKTTRDITEAAAKSFATLAEQLRKRGNDPELVAHFLTQCIFCFFAEDVRLLPDRMFAQLVNNKKLLSSQLSIGLTQLFMVMQKGGLYGVDEIPWFNGGLFSKIEVPALNVMDVTELRNAAELDWTSIDVSIFGTLFERGLDPTKRSQLGAHYTDPATIMRIIEPVIQKPLQAVWEETADAIAKHMAKSAKREDRHHKAAQRVFVEWLNRLSGYRVLDPACGSGNFLFLGLKALKDIEHKSHLDAAALLLDREQDLVTGPQNVIGIELNEYAAELARVTVWIGELQWRKEHGYQFKLNPVLEALDHIECRDALVDESGAAAVWPAASVIVGNPPFLGDKRMRKELGDGYTELIRSAYAGRVPGGADLVCYWFEKAREQIADHGLGAAGLVSTNVIARGANRVVLDRLVTNTRLFDVWDDQEWVNEGAAIRVSMICFGAATQAAKLNGTEVARIFPNLRGDVVGAESLNLTTVQRLEENADANYFGYCLAGPFKVPASMAADWIRQPNPHGRPNSDVLKPIYNGTDLTERWKGKWTIDFGVGMKEEDAALYEKPFEYAAQHVRSKRVGNREAQRALNWWRHGRARPELRSKLAALDRFIATVETAKHRFFVFLPTSVVAEHSLIAIPRADDTTFGLLESRAHFVWTMELGQPYGNHPTARRYNATRILETFPFPEGLTPQHTAGQEVEALGDGTLIPAGLPDEKRAMACEIGHAAKRLDTRRDAWLNPPEWVARMPEVVPYGSTVPVFPDKVVPKNGHEQHVAQRTFTKLYNERPAWLESAHRAIDAAVAVAYGWDDYTPEMSDHEILRRLLSLNHSRSAAS